jgi:hypothetical protein
MERDLRGSFRCPSLCAETSVRYAVRGGRGGGGEESAGRIRSAPERANETRKCTKEVALLYQMSKEGAVSDMPSLEKQGGTERA